MKEPNKVRRSDYKYAHAFLLARPTLCIALAVVFVLIGLAFYNDWAGHSDNITYWEMRNIISAWGTWLIAMIMMLYAFKGFRSAR